MSKFTNNWRKRLQRDKIKGLLNICRKANYLIIGGEKLEQYNKKFYLVLYDLACGKNTLKLIDKLKNKSCQLLAVEALDDLVSIKNCKICAIKNKKLSENIQKLCEEKE